MNRTSSRDYLIKSREILAFGFLDFVKPEYQDACHVQRNLKHLVNGPNLANWLLKDLFNKELSCKTNLLLRTPLKSSLLSACFCSTFSERLGSVYKSAFSVSMTCTIQLMLEGKLSFKLLYWRNILKNKLSWYSII